MKEAMHLRQRCIEGETIERQLAPNELREDREEQIERKKSQDEAEENIEYLDKIKE